MIAPFWLDSKIERLASQNTANRHDEAIHDLAISSTSQSDLSIDSPLSASTLTSLIDDSHLQPTFSDEKDDSTIDIGEDLLDFLVINSRYLRLK